MFKESKKRAGNKKQPAASIYFMQRKASRISEARQGH